MDDSGLFVLVGLLALVVFGLFVGLVIGWFKYRRYGAAVDYGALGIGFLGAGSVALLVLFATDGPWIVGITFMGLGIVYLVRSRGTPGGFGADRSGPEDRTGNRHTTTSADVVGPARGGAPQSRIEVGDRVLLTTAVRLPRRDNDWEHETLPRGTEGVVLATIDDEGHDFEAIGMTDVGEQVAVPDGVFVRAADHEYGIRDQRFTTGQVIVKRPAR